ncbi:MAG TPA: LPS export ABC transporter periplasmic protein LptC [Thermodesulfobacteriota bacterium]|nr:LPS export ABC transporter periplasmic protein LptC [Deltaproteobacteria bacterium]HNR12480.1 LPS export ABC transporter periplasmic protein LptC [Thermodesulfobacteriota bacterium]HNU71204.1 LPS export ABC transporter periplasmic protein LptC [Thermodesulfobacteriota bacterium]
MSFKNKRFFVKSSLAIAALLIFVGVAVIVVNRLFLSSEPDSTVSLPAESTNEADYVIKGINYVSTDKNGVKVWELTAQTAEYFDDQGLIEFDQVSIAFFTKEGHAYALRADVGIVNTETQDFRVSGNVSGSSEKDDVSFRTQSLQYQAGIQEVRTEDTVFLESSRFKLKGQGMVLDLQKEKVYLLHNVEAVGKQELFSGKKP